MEKKEQLYEGKAKILYEGPEPGTLIQYFKDDNAPTVAAVEPAGAPSAPSSSGTAKGP